MKNKSLSIDALILRSFFTDPSHYFSGVVLAEQAGVTRAAIWKHIEQLQKRSYVIEAQPHLGYRLLEAPDRFFEDELLARFGEEKSGSFSCKPWFLEEATSTNDLAWIRAQEGEQEGFIVVAEKQTSGRGRQGRHWESPSNSGIYASLLLRPKWSLREVTRLTILASVAIAEAIEEFCGVEVQIKWPNDLLMKKKKFVGILTEIQADPEMIRFAILGFGINVNQQSQHFSPEVRNLATSLRIETGRDWRRIDILLAVLPSLKKHYENPFDQTIEKWSGRCLSLGQTLTLQTATGKKQGQAVGLDENGALLLRMESGTVETIMSGDIIKTR